VEDEQRDGFFSRPQHRDARRQHPVETTVATSSRRTADDVEYQRHRDVDDDDDGIVRTVLRVLEDHTS
jgi:hypothetical protein